MLPSIPTNLPGNQEVNLYDENYFCNADDKVKFTLDCFRMRF